MGTRPITPEETAHVDELVARGARRARAPSRERPRSRSIGSARPSRWAVANETTFTRLAQMGVEESGIGDPVSRVNKRFKVMGILRDVLRQPSVGVIEDDAREGHRQVRQAGRPDRVARADDEPGAHPARRRACSPSSVATPSIFSPHPRSKRTTWETVEIMRRALAREGAPADLLQCLERPSIPAAQYLMTRADLVQATGGRDMVKAAYSSGTPAYGVGAGNSTMVIDETADVAEAARNTRLSKTSDYGSGCSADGNLLVDDRIYEALRDALVAEGGHVDLGRRDGAAAGRAVGRRGAPHARHDRHLGPGHRGQRAGFEIAPDRTLLRRRADRDRPPQRVQLGEAQRRPVDVPVRHVRRGARHGPGDLRGRRQGPLVRHLLLRRRPHRPPRAGGPGQPHHGPPAAVEGERRARSTTACP